MGNLTPTEFLRYLNRPDPQTAPGEWQTEKNGRRYRMNGNVKEYEEMICLSTGAIIPRSKLEEYNRMKKEQDEQERIKIIEELKKAPKPQSCPLKQRSACIREKCGLWADNRCGVSAIADSKHIELTTAEEAKNKKCGFSPYNCNADCAFFNKGCAIARIAISCNEKK